MSEIDTRRARWVQNSPNTVILKMPARDGGAVLATIENVGFMRTRCPWRAGKHSGVAWTPRDAQRTIRALLRGDV